MNDQFVIKKIMDAKDCPHIPKRIFFQFSNYIKQLEFVFSKQQIDEIIKDLMTCSQKLFHLYGVKKIFYEELNKVLNQMDSELGKKNINTIEYDDNSAQLFNIFSDFLLNAERVLKYTAVLFGTIVNNEDIKTIRKMDTYLKQTKKEEIIKMLEEDFNWVVQLNGLRNEIEHLENNKLLYFGYDIKYENGKKPLIKLPSFNYNEEGEIQLSDYIGPIYINIFTFVEDIIAIGINEKIGKLPLKLLKTGDDDGDLDKVESIYSLNMINAE